MSPTTDSHEVVPFGGPPDAVVLPPGSKSVTNRALVAASLARGRSVLHRPLEADDTAAMVEVLGHLGVRIARDGADLVVDGVDGRPPVGGALLDARLSGTTARFGAPVACLGDATVVLDGAAPLRRRPMADLFTALGELGAGVEPLGDPGCLPVQLEGHGLTGGTVALSGDVSSQFLSGLMLSGPCMRRGLVVDLTTPLVSRPYVEMTAAVMRTFGAEVAVGPSQVVVTAGGYTAVEDFVVEPDASAASYFFALAAVTGGRITVEGLGSSSVQGDLRFAEILREMGASVEIGPDRTTVTGIGALHGVEVDMADCSDTVQTLAAVAPFADSPTTVRGVGFIRGKETDRLAAMVAELRRLGVDATEDEDGLTVRPGRPGAGEVRTYDDHRMAMSLAVMGSVVPGVTVLDPGCVAKTYPGFWEDLDAVRRTVPAPPVPGSA